jgi:hypothetical protein
MVDHFMLPVGTEGGDRRSTRVIRIRTTAAIQFLPEWNRGRIVVMVKPSSGIVPLFLLSAAQAQTSAPEPPVESNPIGLIIFALLFVGFCVGFIWMTWWRDKAQKAELEEHYGKTA